MFDRDTREVPRGMATAVKSHLLKFCKRIESWTATPEEQKLVGDRKISFCLLPLGDATEVSIRDSC